jgi:hypothetical protein
MELDRSTFRASRVGHVIAPVSSISRGAPIASIAFLAIFTTGEDRKICDQGPARPHLSPPDLPKPPNPQTHITSHFVPVIR